jgi:HD-GYP domain-containing protein (c-di-GMP phosphodiesterase class II)
MSEYQEIKISEIIPNKELGFDVYVYLPSKNKYIKYFSGSDSITQQKINKLIDKGAKSLFVKSKEYETYLNYLKELEEEMMNNADVNHVDKINIIMAKIRQTLPMIKELENDADVVEWAENCEHLIESLVTILIGRPVKLEEDDDDEKIDPNEAFSRLKDGLGEKCDIEDHAAIVGSLSMILGMLTGLNESKLRVDLSVGGLLHDIGMLDMDSELIHKFYTETELSEEELSAYKTHCSKGVEFVNKALKSPIISDNVVSIIRMHHENSSGSGFPEGISINRLPSHIKLIAIVDKVAKYLHKGMAMDLRYCIYDIFQEQSDMDVRELDVNMIKQLLTKVPT